MAKDTKPLEVLNTQTKQAFEQTKQATERSVEEAKVHALNAVDSYFDFLNRAVSSLPSGGTEFGDRLKSFSEKNVATTHQFVRQLGQAKDFQTVFRLQAEFMQTQMQAFAEQAKVLAETFAKTAASEVKLPFKTSLE